jgi:hypothetical protein
MANVRTWASLPSLDSNLSGTDDLTTEDQAHERGRFTHCHAADRIEQRGCRRERSSMAWSVDSRELRRTRTEACHGEQPESACALAKTLPIWSAACLCPWPP